MRAPVNDNREDPDQRQHGWKSHERERGGGGGGVGLSVDGGPWWTESATGLVGVEMHLGRLLLLIGYVPS